MARYPVLDEVDIARARAAARAAAAERRELKKGLKRYKEKVKASRRVEGKWRNGELVTKPEQRREPFGPANRILSLVGRFLPATERAEHIEAFRAELAELTRVKQLRYSLSLLRGAADSARR